MGIVPSEREALLALGSGSAAAKALGADTETHDSIGRLLPSAAVPPGLSRWRCRPSAAGGDPESPGAHSFLSAGWAHRPGPGAD
jgi:hypothetical protein